MATGLQQKNLTTAVRDSAVLASELCHDLKAPLRLFQVMNGCEMQCGQAMLAELDSVKRSIGRSCCFMCYADYKIDRRMAFVSQRSQTKVRV